MNGPLMLSGIVCVVVAVAMLSMPVRRGQELLRGCAALPFTIAAAVLLLLAMGGGR